MTEREQIENDIDDLNDVWCSELLEDKQKDALRRAIARLDAMLQADEANWQERAERAERENAKLRDVVINTIPVLEVAVGCALIHFTPEQRRHVLVNHVTLKALREALKGADHATPRQ